MIDLTDEVRRSLTELADRAHPVLLGDAAIRRVRRRRSRRRLSAVAAALAVLALLLPAWWAQHKGDPGVHPTAGPAGTTPAIVGPASHVIAAFAGSGGAWQLLNPVTGQYFPAPQATNAVAFSADLRTAAVLTSAGKLGIIRTTGDAPTSWISLPSATEYTALSISGDGERIAVPLWAETVAERKVFRRYAVADTGTLRFSVTQVQQSEFTVATSLSWQDANLLITTFSARTIAGEPDPGPHSTYYSTMAPDTGELSDTVGVPWRSGPSYTWDHQLVRGNMVVMQTQMAGRPAFAIARLSGDSLMHGPVPLDAPPSTTARAVGWDQVADTILVESGAPLRLMALKPRTGQQDLVNAPIPADATRLVLGNGDIVSPDAANLRF